MHKSTLREIAKFASGLILADFLVGAWFYFGGYLPTAFFGITFTPEMTVGWMIFDVLLFAFLVHYAWKMGDRPRTSEERRFHIIAGTLFTLVALLHFSRIVFGWNFVLGSWSVPYWLNGLGTIITIILAYISFDLAVKK